MAKLTQYELFMGRCLQLAACAENVVAPNPMVGAVLVHEGKIISEGYHQQFGNAHAEVNALKNINDSNLLENSTLYVSLEPCSHHGKTPPCADLILEKRIPKVVLATLDPNPMVAGRGVQKLKENGVEVSVGVLEQQARELNKRFMTFQQEKRPYVILKWAETADGFIAKEDNSSKWISSPEARTLAHQWRSQEMAILAGTNTVLHDNPTLDTRLWKGKSPIRCLIDLDLKIPKDFNIFSEGALTLVFNCIKSEIDPQSNVELINISSENLIAAILSELKTRNISSLLVEGGAKTHQTFMDSGTVDEIRQVVSKNIHFEKGISAVKIPSGFTTVQTLTLEKDIIFIHRKLKPTKTNDS